MLSRQNISRATRRDASVHKVAVQVMRAITLLIRRIGKRISKKSSQRVDVGDEDERFFLNPLRSDHNWLKLSSEDKNKKVNR